MKTTAAFLFFLISAAILSLTVPPVLADGAFRIGIMQDQKGAAAKFGPLLTYLKKSGIEASFVAARSYPDAARMFADGSIDGMFSGSGIAGCLIIKKAAYPVARPVSLEGWSTYWAVVLALQGSNKFTQNADYFDGKRVIFCGLASSGEFFFRSVAGNRWQAATVLKASSHGAAIDALARGAADIAIVKNRVWEKAKENYPGILQVGEDPGENPDGALMVSNSADPAVVEKISALLLGLSADPSTEAAAVKEKLNISGYVKTTIDDFKFTIPLLRRAGVTRSFNFAF